MSWEFYTPLEGATGFGTSLPATPVEGEQFILTDSITAPTYQWLLRYVGAKASNKWVFIGGPPLSNEVATGEGTTSATYTALATAGPSVAIPVAGDYHIELGANITISSAASYKGHMSYDIGGTGAVDADSVYVGDVTDSRLFEGSVARLKKKTGLTAVTLTAKYRVTSAGQSSVFSYRWLAATPIAIGG